MQPSREGGVRGTRCNQEQALPRHRARAKRPNNCWVEVAGSDELDLWPNTLPIDRIIEMVSLARPPSVSATTGMKSTPAERHTER